jgi:hypothetical protein
MKHDPLRLRQTPLAPSSLRRALRVASRLDPTPEDLERVALALAGPRIAKLTVLEGAPIEQPSELAPDHWSPPSGFIARRPARRRRAAVALTAALLAATFSLAWAGARLWSRSKVTIMNVTAPRRAEPIVVPSRPIVAPQPVVRTVESLPEETEAAKPEKRAKARRVISRNVSSPEVEEPAAPAEVETVSNEDTAPKELSEVQLLFEARRALGSDPTQALQWVRKHEQRFAGGPLSQEREVLAIEALRRLGRVSEANARAARFRERYPASIHDRRVETTSPSRTSQSGLDQAP